MAGDLLACEFHDATFEGLTLDASFAVYIKFSVLVCYYASSDAGMAEVWASAGELRVGGAQRLVVNSPVHDAQWVSDLAIVPASGESMDPNGLDLLRGKRWASACLRMVGDASIQIEGGIATLILGERGRMLEQVAWPMI